MIKLFPIQIAFPNSKIPAISREKTSFFSDLSPVGGAKKYQFFDEQVYYKHYSQSYFAVTTKKAGWDCLRHYEIAASGALPYFLDLKDCPKDTLFAWPKDLLEDIKKIPGMPSERQVRWATRRGRLHKLKMSKDFDEKLYWSYHEKFRSIFLSKLTTQGLSDYFLGSIDKPHRKILFLFGISGSLVDYVRDLLLTSLASNPNVELTTYPKPFWLLKSCHAVIRSVLYGRGFTYTGNLTEAMFLSPEDWQEVENQIDQYDLIVACTSSNQGFEVLPREVQATLAKRSDVVWIDGNDIKGNHDIPACAKMVFRREMLP